MSSTREPGRIIPVEPEFIRRVGEISEAEDLLLYGNSFTTRSGARLDPRSVVAEFDGATGELTFVRYRDVEVVWSDTIVFPASEVNHRKSGSLIFGLTTAEREVLRLSADLWNAFVKLPKEHPSDIPEFQAALHELQALIALRVARRVNPEVWR